MLWRTVKMAIRINNKDYLNYEEQVLKNKKDVEDINTEIGLTNLALIGKKNVSPNTERIKTFTKDDFVTDGLDKVLNINYGNTSTLQYDAVIVDLEGLGVDNGGAVKINSYMDISLQIHNSDLVTDLAGARTSFSYLQLLINTPIAKQFGMIKGVAFWNMLEPNGSYADLIGSAKTVWLELISDAGVNRRCDLVIHFSNPIYMLDAASEW